MRHWVGWWKGKITKKINKVTRASVERKKMYEPKLGTGSLL